VINKDVNVTFKHGWGAASRTLVSDVEFGFEVVGNDAVVENIDYELIEDWDDIRLLIDVRVELDLVDAHWMKNFLSAKNSKILSMDGYDFWVVNNFERVNFPLLAKGSRLFVSPQLRFRGKEKGLSVLDTDVTTAVGYLKQMGV
jgi:hypothetical protein